MIDICFTGSLQINPSTFNSLPFDPTVLTIYLANREELQRLLGGLFELGFGLIRQGGIFKAHAPGALEKRELEEQKHQSIETFHIFS